LKAKAPPTEATPKASAKAKAKPKASLKRKAARGTPNNHEDDGEPAPRRRRAKKAGSPLS